MDPDIASREVGQLRRLGALIWSLLLIVTLSVLVRAIITRTTKEPIWVKAESQPNERVVWKAGHNIFAASDSILQITAKQFGFFGWRGARLLVDVFGDAPLVPGVKTIDSQHLELETQDPAELTINFESLPTWRAVESGGRFAELNLFRLESDPSGWDPLQQLYATAIIRGRQGSEFKVDTHSRDCKEECKGQFSGRDVAIFPSNPPGYAGPGAAGITRIWLEPRPDSYHQIPPFGFQQFQGVRMSALGMTHQSLKEHAEVVSMSVQEGQLYFNGQTRPLIEGGLLRVTFAKSDPGSLEVSSNNSTLIEVRGIATSVRLGDDNLMPREIDAWPWYVQLLIGTILAFLVERIYATVSGGSLLRRIFFKGKSVPAIPEPETAEDQ